MGTDTNGTLGLRRRCGVGQTSNRTARGAHRTVSSKAAAAPDRRPAEAGTVAAAGGDAAAVGVAGVAGAAGVVGVAAAALAAAAVVAAAAALPDGDPAGQRRAW